MKPLRLLVAAVFVLAVMLEGWPGVVIGCSVVAIGELIGLRWRLAGAIGSFARTSRRRRSDPGTEVPFPGLQREYDFGSLRGFDLVLRHRLTDAAAVRLAERHGVDIATQPDRARALLGDDVWALLDPARPNASHADGTRVPRRWVAAAVAAIERL